MTDAILIPTLVAAAACLGTVALSHLIINVVRKVNK